MFWRPDGHDGWVVALDAHRYIFHLSSFFLYIRLIILILTLLCSGMVVWQLELDIGETGTSGAYDQICGRTIIEGRLGRVKYVINNYS